MAYGNNQLDEETAKTVNHQIKEIEEHMQDGDFQTDFFESLKSQFHSKEWLSDKQLDCLDRMYERVTR